jgi:ketosteroid isomerase-like protein
MTLRESVEAFGEAWAARDIEKLRSLLSPDYVHTDFEGRVFDRDAWLAYASKQTHGAALTFRDLEFREYGQFALVVGANEISGGTMGAATIRFTQLWRLTGEGWRRLAFQATVAK